MIIGVRARGAAAPQTRAKAKLFGQKPAAKNEKKLYLLNEINGIHSV